MFVKYSLWRIGIGFLSVIHSILAGNNYRENLPLRQPCNSINKRLESYITWTEKLASSQYKGESFHFTCQ
jgi:hypothetical protein